MSPWPFRDILWPFTADVKLHQFVRKLRVLSTSCVKDIRYQHHSC